MARGKKKEVLSLEEKLEQALVPVEEQPYKVPENWCWTRLDYVADYKKGPFGSAITKAMFVPKANNTYKVYEQGNAIRKTVQYGNYYITEEKYNELKGFAVKAGDLIVSCAGTIGETYQLPEEIEEGVINQALMRVKVSNKINLQYYLFYFDEMLRQDITGSSKGSAIKNIPPFSILKNFPIPLPPVKEQQRIVEQIESLFTKLDEAKYNAECVLETLELHKESIRHRTFLGKYTEKWRNENKLSMASWPEKKLGELLQPMRTRKPKEHVFRYIDIDAIDNKKQIVREVKELFTSEAPSRASRAVEEGDILFSMVRPYLKNIAYIEKDLADCIASTGFYVCSCKNGLDSRYLYEYLRSKDTIDYLMQFMRGDNSPSIRKDDLLEMVLKIPSIQEQQKIVLILKDTLSKIEKIKDKAIEVIDCIEIMKKSILAKAFRGELGTNNPNEESAIELLKQILQD